MQSNAAMLSNSHGHQAGTETLYLSIMIAPYTRQRRQSGRYDGYDFDLRQGCRVVAAARSTKRSWQALSDRARAPGPSLTKLRTCFP